MSHISTQEYDGLSKYGGTVKTRRRDRGVIERAHSTEGALKPEISSMRNSDNTAGPTSRDWGPVYPHWTKLGFSNKEVQTSIPLLSMELNDLLQKIS